MPRGTPKTPDKPVRFSPGVPPPPPWLDEAAIGEYQRVAGQLEVAGDAYLQQVDMSDLSTYAQAYSDVVRLTPLVRAEGEALTSDKGNLYPNPRNNALQMAYNRMSKAAARLGFSPTDRARIGKKTGGKGKDDPLKDYI